MKIIQKILLLMILSIYGCSNKSDYPWFLGSLENAKSYAGEKLIMLDFYASW